MNKIILIAFIFFKSNTLYAWNFDFIKKPLFNKEIENQVDGLLKDKNQCVNLDLLDSILCQGSLCSVIQEKCSSKVPYSCQKKCGFLADALNKDLERQENVFSPQDMSLEEAWKIFGLSFQHDCSNLENDQDLMNKWKSIIIDNNYHCNYNIKECKSLKIAYNKIYEYCSHNKKNFITIKADPLNKEEKDEIKEGEEDGALSNSQPINLERQENDGKALFNLQDMSLEEAWKIFGLSSQNGCSNFENLEDLLEKWMSKSIEYDCEDNSEKCKYLRMALYKINEYCYP